MKVRMHANVGAERLARHHLIGCGSGNYVVVARADRVDGLVVVRTMSGPDRVNDWVYKRYKPGDPVEVSVFNLDAGMQPGVWSPHHEGGWERPWMAGRVHAHLRPEPSPGGGTMVHLDVTALDSAALDGAAIKDVIKGARQRWIGGVSYGAATPEGLSIGLAQASAAEYVRTRIHAWLAEVNR
jgi:hypothetical protein